jgi:catechol 2,3-dioxygenase-like lactoylglutathione lyase family enzyme
VHRSPELSVRYIVNDVEEAIDFYRDRLGFVVDMHPAPGFARLTKGSLALLLNQPGAGGAGQAMPDGTMPRPGGWNRIQLEVDDLDATVDGLRKAGCQLRSEIITGQGGRQILVDDPSGNAVELFEST